MKRKIVAEISIALINLMSFIVATTGLGNSGGKTWSYELKEVKSTSSDPEKMNIAFTVERVSRGVYAISGDFYVNFDIVDGDSNTIEAKSFRSTVGDNNYKVLPFQMPKSHFYKVLNTYYKDVIMDTMKECSDFPVFEDTFQPPLEKKNYQLKACQFSQDGLPNHLQEGFYKLTIAGSGEVDWQLDIIAEVTAGL